MKSFLYFILLLLCSNWLFAQELGKPFIKNYPPSTYHAENQNWQFVQDNRGLIYIGNSNGILEYDGESWRNIVLPNHSISRGLAKSKDGVIYVGSQTSFGYLTPDSIGVMQYQSLSNALPKEHESFNDVWSVHATDDGVYFLTDFKFYRMNLSGEFDRLWVPNGKYFFLSFAIGNDIYVHEPGIGPMKLIDNKFQLLEGASQLADKFIYAILPYTDGTLLLVTNNEGIYIYDPALLGNDAIYPFKGKITDELNNNVVYTATQVSDERYAFGTRRNGVYIMDTKGNEVLNINQKKGLINNQVWHTGLDEQGGLWICTNKGLSRVELHTPFTYWDEEENVGPVFGTTRFRDKIYIATDQGVYFLNPATNLLEEVSNIKRQCWLFYQFTDNKGKERLLVGTDGGVFEIDGNKAKIIRDKGGVYDFLRPSLFPNHLFFASTEGLGVLSLESKEIKFKGIVNGFNEETRTLGEDDKKQVFVGSLYKGIGKLTYNVDEPFQPQITVYDTTHGLPSIIENEVVLFDDKLFFSTEKGLYKFDNERNRFVPEQQLSYVLDSNNIESTKLLGKDKEGKVWYYNSSFFGNMNLKTKEKDSTLFTRLPAVNGFFPESNGIVWFATSDGLFRYNENQNEIIPSYNVILRQVLAANDSLVFGGTFTQDQNNQPIALISLRQTEKDRYVFPYELASSSLLFKFAAPSYDIETKNEYQYILEKESAILGLKSSSNWSHWEKKSEKEYTNLREGTYVLRVKARNVYGIESEEMSYTFSILAPWYRTIYAYIFYVVMGLLAIWWIVKLNTMRLKKQNERLERIVNERTFEIQQQKEEILSQNEELQQQKEEIVTQRDYIDEQNKSLKEKNTRILDSIRYAKTIQEGILPFTDRLNKELPDHFVVYRPKDIVSGDFYWFEMVEGIKYFAVVDCTGHGVPGAFMSMIGSAILNELVLKNRLFSPATILEEMNLLVKKVLKQEHIESNQDGMDVGLVSWKEENGEVQVTFAGAHRPLYYIADNTLHEVRGTRKAIGGYHAKDRAFDDISLVLQKGDQLFLTSDGYADQHNKKNKKIGSKRLRELLEHNGKLSMSDLGEVLNNYLDKYQVGVEQRDDITVVGIQL